MNTEQKIALVTGGTRGIGQAIVEELVSRGYFVAFTYHASVERAQELVERLGAARVRAHALSANDPTSVQAFATETLQLYPKIDLLVSNAGVTRASHFLTMKEGDWHEVLQTNFTGLFHLWQAIAKKMMYHRQGSMILISSVAALRGQPGQSNYAASKAALVNFSQTLARELGRYNVRVNSISPGFVETDMTHKIDRVILKGYVEGIPLKRMGKAVEVAKAVAFLASDDASYISGSNLLVDGGLSS